MHLQETASAAALGCRRVPADNPDVIRFSRHEFVRIFIARWLIRDASTLDCNAVDLRAYSGLWYYVFQRNFDVTNIALEELKSLVKKNAFYRDTDSSKVSVLDFNRYMHVVESAIGDERLFKSDYKINEYKPDFDYFIANFCNTYGPLLESSIVLEPFHNSCLVYIPHGLLLDCTRVASDSGYIYCGGVPIYVRNAAKCASDEIKNKFLKFIAADSGDRPFFIAPLAEEFNLDDEGSGNPISYKNGLDEMRIKMRKHYVEGVTLFESLSKLGLELRNDIKLASGMNQFSEEAKDLTDISARSIWIHSDYSIQPQDKVKKYGRGTDQYIFAYLQLIKNTNPLFAFKERKPAWTAAITLPHTLSSAMLNIATDGLKSTSFRFLDPFAGTGTTLIDAALRYPEATIIGFDRNPVFFRLVEDNFEFLKQTPTDIEAIRDRLLGLSRELNEGQRIEGLSSLGSSESLGDLRGIDFLRYVVNLILGSTDEKSLFTNPDELMQRLNNLKEGGFPGTLLTILVEGAVPFESRLIVYLIWRAIIQNIYSISASKDALRQALRAEFNRSIKEFSYLSSKYALCRQAVDAGLDCFRLSRGTFSDQVIFTFEQFREVRLTRHAGIESIRQALLDYAPGVHILRVEDSLDACAELKNSFEVIVCDPPYGFNTHEGGASAMRGFFGRLMPFLLDTLSENGRVVAAVAEAARNGRSIPFYQTSEFLDRSIRQFCMDKNFRITSDDFDDHSFDQLQHRSIYWSSSNSLDRRILNYRVAKQ